MTLLLALALAAAPPAPFAVEVVRASPRHARVVLAPRAGDQAALVIRFHAGAVDDGGASGLTRLAQHVLLEANLRVGHGDLLRQVFGAGATLTMSTRLRDASLVLTAPRQDFPRLARLVLEAVRAPQIDERAWAAAVDRSLADIKVPGRGADLAAFVARRVVDDARYHNEPFGERADLERITRARVLKHLQGPMAPANSTVVVAGAFDPGAARALLRGHAGGERLRGERPRVDTPFSLQIPARREIYLIAYRAALDEPRQAAAARLLADLVEERLLERFRGAGVGYAAQVTPLHNGWLDQFLLLLPTDEPSGQDMGPVLEEQLARVRRGDFGDDEVERSRGAVLAGLERTDRDPRALALALADGDGTGWYGPATVAAARALSRAELQAAAAELLDDRRSIRVFFSPKASSAGVIPDNRRGEAR